MKLMNLDIYQKYIHTPQFVIAIDMIHFWT